MIPLNFLFMAVIFKPGMGWFCKMNRRFNIRMMQPIKEDPVLKERSRISPHTEKQRKRPGKNLY